MLNLNKKIPAAQKEESASSREFWMFIGSLVILISAIIITVQTSVPVYNKLFNKTVAPPQDVEFSYNRVQILIAMIIGMLTAVGQYLKYRETGKSYFLRKIVLPFTISLLVSGAVIYFGDINYDKYGAGYMIFVWLALTFSIFAVVANLAYIWIGIKGKLQLSGPSVAHFGFALMLTGILISSSKKEILSYNTSGIFVPFGEGSKEKEGENMTLVKGVKMDMGKYWVTYLGDSTHPKKSQKYFNIAFKDKKTNDEFVLSPDAFINYKGNEGLSANPDAKHYLNYDVFAYITALADPEKNKDTASFKNKVVKTGDTIYYSSGYMILDSVQLNPVNPRAEFKSTDTAILAKISVNTTDGKKLTARPYFYLRSNQLEFVPDTLIVQGLTLRLQKIVDNKFEIGIKESKNIQDFLTLKVYKFPFINLLWAGTIIMAIGFIISMVRRIQLNRTQG
jgi:cytochrome c-type biogenesis protein CcmF